MENDWLTDELMQRASKILRQAEAFPSQGTVYVVSRALYEAEKRGREEAAKIAASFGTEERRGERHGETSLDADIIAAAIRSGQ